ncbi:AAA family ATPase [Aliarcobacter sp. ERUVET-7]|jgi:archaellum biogenesis ATPase FlaH|uniref:AAA family ATPase n=1 Tax=Aliarcobacter sp. ERUVET-7 TaxID=3429683 RepID=UPI003D6BEB25
MSSLIQKIENRIKNQQQIPDLIEKIDNIISNNSHIISQNELEQLKIEKIDLEKKIIKPNLSFAKKFDNFFYKIEDLDNTPEIQWLISGVIPSSTIGVFYGAPGTGKSSILIRYCLEILKNYDNAYIIYIDADMAISKISELGIGNIIKQYGERFRYAGKSFDNISVVSQNLLKDVVSLQQEYPARQYIVLEDSLTLITPRRNGFIDVQQLYKYERKIRDLNGTIIIVTHLNKAGIFADSQQIENYADYTYLVQRNDFNSSILLIPKKASRYSIIEKAYRTEDRKIVEEIDFEIANISHSESYFVNTILDLLKDGEINQSDIMKYLKQISFFTKYSIGEKKVISLLEKWAQNGKWCLEQRAGEKNAKYYFLYQTAKLEKLPNYYNKEI